MSKASILQRVIALLCFASPFLVFSQNSSGGSSGGIPFSYSLSTNAKTSGGVFKPDSTLVRTLWSSEQKTAGSYTTSWDGKNDSGNLVPDGNYNIKVLSNNVTYSWDGVVGNTSVNNSGPTVHHNSQFITNMVQVGNFMHYVHGYAEIANIFLGFNLGEPNIKVNKLTATGMAISQICTDGIKVYYSGTINNHIPQPSESNNGICATQLNNDGTYSQYIFSSGQPMTEHASSFSIIDASPFTFEQDPQTQLPYRFLSAIYGLTVQQTGNYLFSAYRVENTIHVLNKVTGALIRTVSMNAPREIKMQGESSLWAITGTNTVAKYTVNSDGTLTAATLTLSGFTKPLALAVSADGSRVAVADSGSAYQVKIYNTSTGSIISTLGRNESYANPTVYDDKFFFQNNKTFNEFDPGQAHCFLTYQSDGSIWVGDYGNLRAQHFSSNNVYVNNIQYTGYTYSAQADLNNPTRVFSDFNEFKIDYSKPLSPTNGSWKFIRNWSKYLNRQTVYDDTRMRGVTTLSNGRTYMIYNDGARREVIDLDTTTGARHTGIYLDNNLCDINSDGSQWQIGENQLGQTSFWKRRPLIGFTANNPTWGAAVTYTMPIITNDDPITQDGGLGPNQVTSTNIIAGFNSNNPLTDMGRGSGYHLGGFKNGKWLWKVSPATHKNYRGEYPDDGAYDIGNGVNYPAGFMQALDRNIFWSYKGENWHEGQANKYQHYYDDGLMVGVFGITGLDVRRSDEPEAYPGMAGNAGTGTYVKVGGNIYVYHCDEAQHGAVHRWKISGLNTIQEQVTNVIKSGIPPAPIQEYIDLMAGLPFNDTLTNNTAGWTRFAPESPIFSVKTNYGTYKKDERDLRIFSHGQNIDCWVKRDLGTNTSLINWKIVGEMSYPEAGENQDNFMEVRDANDKIIVRISRPESYPNLEVKANSSRIAFGQDVYATVGRLLPLSIVAANGTITVSFGNYAPVTVTPFESSANIGNPKTLQLYTVSNPSGHQIDVALLKLYKNFGIAVSTIHFRSKGSGLWKNTSSWQSSSDSTSWVEATVIPDSSSNSITIQNGHTITLTDTAIVDQLMVQGGAGFRVAPNALLIVNNGTGNDITVAGSASMIIQSDATGTGRIGNSSGNISGNVTVERYISSNNNKAYRLLASSVNTAGGPKPYIRSNWQEGQNNMSIISNSNIAPNYGIHITGNMLGNNGFDATALGLASMLYYNQAASSQDWAPIANTDATSFDAKKGYMVYIRGDRSTDLHTNTTSSNTTLRTTGTIASGTQVYSGQEGNGRNSLVTNPYACPVDWSAIYNDASTSNGANFENYYTYLDPNIGLSGGYVTVNANGTKSAATTATTEIQPGQAFFIRAKTGIVSPTFTVKENHKSGTANLNIFRTGSREQFRSSLYFTDGSGVRKMADAVNSVFDTAFSTAIDGNDAEEMANWDENVSISRAAKMLSIEGRPLIDITDTIQLAVQRLKIQNYEWQFEPTGFMLPSLKAYLEDRYLNTRTQMNLTSTTVISFSVTAIPGSAAVDRFRIVFAINSSLPVTMRSLKAYQKGTGVQVEWVTDHESNVDRYEVERSADGMQFIKAGTVPAATTGNLVNYYSWFDPYPKEGNNYYRIKTIDKNGTISYSQIVNIKIGSKKESFEVYPNPVTGKNLIVQFNSIAKGTYTISLINEIGQKIFNKVIYHSGNSASQTISVSENLPAGSYNLQISGDGILYNKKLVK